jgi:hypothetical protein
MLIVSPLLHQDVSDRPTLKWEMVELFIPPKAPLQFDSPRRAVDKIEANMP